MTPTRTSAPIKCVIPYAGGKRTLAPRIVELLGEHDTYLEPFVGGCSILPVKPRAAVEIVNDANPVVANVLLQLRNEPVSMKEILDGRQFNRETFDKAVKFLASKRHPVNYSRLWQAANRLVVWWMGANGYAGTTKNGWFAQRHTKTGGDPAVRWESFKRSLPTLLKRLEDVEITNLDFRQFFAVRPHDLPGVAIYADPPYFAKRIQYAHDFTPKDHADLAAILNRYRRARVVVSYYDAPELATLYPPDRWERHEVAVSKASANARAGATKTEAVELLLVNRT